VSRATRKRRRGGRHAAPREASGPAPTARNPSGPPAPPPVLLAWALDREGRRVQAAALDRQRRRELAPFACPGCGEELVAKLGSQRARHFAHRPGSTCALTRPETLLHFNAKERLLFLCDEAFEGRMAVRVRARCPRCRREAPLDLGALGDAAAAEGTAGALRADVLVTRAGTPALAFEVKVTHAVDAVKQEALARLGLPALEIDAREEWEEEIPGGVALRIARTFGVQSCPSCQLAGRAETDRARGGEEAEVAELEAYRARGLFGPRPGPALAMSEPLSDGERRRLAAGFRCPECGGAGLTLGARLVRHACPGRSDRPVAWRGYDGALVELSWWRRDIG